MYNNDHLFRRLTDNVDEVNEANVGEGEFGVVTFRLIRGTQTGQTGSVYEIWNGSYGYAHNILLKEAKLCHSDLVYNEIKFLQQLHCSLMFPIFSTFEDGPTSLLLAQEPYQENCETILDWYKLKDEGTEHQRIKGFNVRRLFTEVWSALEFLHGNNIVHRDIRAKNVYIQSADGSWRTVVSGLKYAIVKGEEDDGVEKFYREKKWDWVPLQLGKVKYDVNSDLYCTACLMYSFYKEKLIRSPKKKLEMDFDWNETSYKRLHLKHFIRVVIASSDRTIDTGSFMNHPFFKDEAWMSSFEDRLRWYSYDDRRLDPTMETDKSYVFKGNFLNSVEPDVKELVLKTLRQNGDVMAEVGQTFVELWRAVRIRHEHRDENLILSQNMAETLPVENFRFWANRFPYFFLHLFLRVTQFTPNPFRANVKLCSLAELAEFFPGDILFYQKCCATSIEVEKDWQSDD